MNYQNPTPPAGFKPVRYRSLMRFAFLLLLLLATLTIDVTLVPTALAADAQIGGTISGRVLNAENGKYLGRARVSIETTNQETYTNDFGEYSFHDVKPGQVEMKVFYTGMGPLTARVSVAEGALVKKDFSFGGEVTALNEFLVETNRYHNAQEIATNEERTSVTLKNVVAADAFGKIANGNIGEFVKFLPGVQVDYGGSTLQNGALASSISVRGFGAEQTAIMINGRQVADPSVSGLTRAVGLDMLSINNASRVEVIKVATPDMPSTSPGGAINLIPLSAFEYDHPVYTVGLQASVNTEDTKIFSKEPGPANKETFHTLPGGDLQIIYPFSHKLGISFTASTYNEYSPNFSSSPKYLYAPVSIDLSKAGGANGVLTNAQGQATDLAHPYVSSVALTTSPWEDYRLSTSLGVDWRPVPSLTFNTSFSYSTYDGTNVARRMSFGAPFAKDFGPDFTTGLPYVNASQTTNNTAIDTKQTVAQSVSALDKSGSSGNFVVTGKWDHGPWHVGAGASRARALGKSEGASNGHFTELDLAYTPGSVSFAGIDNGVPNKISVTDKAGAPFDYTKIASYSSGTGIQASTGESASRETISIYNVDLRRDLDFLPIDTSIKVGVYRKDDERSKWGVGTGYRYDYTGPALTVDQFLDPINTGSPWKNQPPQQWADVYRFYNLFQTHPEQFSQTSVATQVSNYNTGVNQYKSVTERNDNYYAMIDGTFFHSRLSYVAGIRSGHNSDDGYGPVKDNAWQFAKLPNGQRYVDSADPTGVNFTTATWATDAGLIARMKAAGVSVPSGQLPTVVGNSLEASQRSLKTGTIHGTQNQPITPTVAFSYKITDNLIAKLSWSRETALPNIEGLGNTGAILSTTASISDANPQTGTPGGDGTITVSNPDLKPQRTDSYNGTLSYYTKNGGKLEGSYYYKQIKNQWENDTIISGDEGFDQTLSALGFSSVGYENYAISTTVNGLSSAVNKGYELSFQQNLGILADFGKYFDVFGTYSHKAYQRSAKPGVISLTATADDLSSGGVRFSFRRFSMSLRGTHRNAVLGGNSGTTVTYNGLKYSLNRWAPAVLKLDAEIHFQATKKLDLYISAANVTNQESTQRTYDTANIVPNYAAVTSDNLFGTQIIGGATYKF